MKSKQPILLCIFDGFGIAKTNLNNAISQAKTPNLDYLNKTYAHTEVSASGLAVGLPEGQMGNSEVGHLQIGAGRVVYQSLTLINKAISEKTFFTNETILKTIKHAQKNNSNLHILGLLSDGGVHSHINHILALLEIAAKENFKNVYVHAILDGRDTKSDVAKIYVQQLLDKMTELKTGYLASISGRYYAMDRDKRFDRAQIAYDAIVNHKGIIFTDPIAYINSEYAADRNDEFINPAYNPELARGNISNNDSIIFANFRPDRAIQLASALTNPKYDWNIANKIRPLKNTFFVSMMEYANSVKAQGVIFPPTMMIDGLGEWLSKNQYHQLRIAETEKYAHVTYFFDGGVDIEYPLSTRILIPSPKVATYDLKPEMSAREITSRLEIEIAKNIYDVMILNFANPDMVGHTGNLKAAISAIEVVDECVGKLYNAMKNVNGILMITADHGNAEVMVDAQGAINKKHTSQPVPFIICQSGIKLKSDGCLADIAPTLLEILGLEKPEVMTNQSLLKK
ncbi:2,3-bisphosphoglycerate-independent phosphoglycerate mutase [Spiroplasma sp. AdecLV25b]|uniref:2,3-bisphosphoglycerate-independent phosphoglycerate mutase n=1 Tax=Spiroplasma sp. AdecLV25b TaxID=3027162 RepID=UPI0027E149DE|nr:2,3-bisphosphoglycerate-independent phosphoglycerate mutase [Spiroplasma sp. AdecLV25b]